MDILQTPAVPSTDSAICSDCGAPLVSDQRYCLACGAPVSPVRLAFLDVLQAEHAPAERGAFASATGYVQLEEQGPGGWLRRYSGLLSLLTVLLLTMLIGLLVGHWLTQKAAPTNQVLTVKGLSLPASSPATGAAPEATTSPGSTSKEATSKAAGSASKAASVSASKASQGAGEGSAKRSEAAEAKEVKEAEAKPLPKPAKANPNTLKALSKKTGKSYEQELNKLDNGDQPIEG